MQLRVLPLREFNCERGGDCCAERILPRFAKTNPSVGYRMIAPSGGGSMSQR